MAKDKDSEEQQNFEDISSTDTMEEQFTTKEGELREFGETIEKIASKLREPWWNEEV